MPKKYKVQLKTTTVGQVANVGTTISKYTVRKATNEDMPAIRRCHAGIEAPARGAVDLPEVDDIAMLEYWVVEKDGEIIGGMYMEKMVRQCDFGFSPEAAAVLRPLQDQILRSSKEAGVRFVHMSVPKALPLAEEISHDLEASGYQRRDDLLQLMFDLRYLPRTVEKASSTVQ